MPTEKKRIGIFGWGVVAPRSPDIERFEANPAIKAMMKLVGPDCGGTRLPQRALAADEVAALREGMEAIGFFDWGRG